MIAEGGPLLNEMEALAGFTSVRKQRTRDCSKAAIGFVLQNTGLQAERQA